MLVNIPDSAIEWLKSGHRGTSSETIFKHLTGVPISVWSSTPSDPSDLHRCRLLLDAVPEFAKRFDEMRTASPRWARLVDAWPQLCALMDSEGQRCPKTWALMEQLNYGITRAKKAGA